jgi:ankyrin repeat protein
MTALHYAARDGFAGAVEYLLEAGMNVNTPTAGDKSSPLLVAIVNGQYDIAMTLVEKGANVNQTNDDLMAPLFAVINNEWALRTWYPQPTAGHQQRTSYLQLIRRLAAAGADPNTRVKSHVWHAAYNAGRMGVEFTGATAFWRAAYALDVEAMKLLVEVGADPTVPTMTFGSAVRANDQSGVPAVPAGGTHIPPFHAASGVGYGTSRVAQQHQYVHDGWMPAAKYFLEELGVDVNIRDADGFTALHHAAARGDNAMIQYLVSKGANVMAVNRAGQTTVDMANSPEQRTQPFPETIKLLEGMGAKNNNNCQACK